MFFSLWACLSCHACPWSATRHLRLYSITVVSLNSSSDADDFKVLFIFKITLRAKAASHISPLFCENKMIFFSGGYTHMCTHMHIPTTTLTSKMSLGKWQLQYSGGFYVCHSHYSMLYGTWYERAAIWAKGWDLDCVCVSTSTLLAGAAGETVVACSLLNISHLIIHDRSLKMKPVMPLLFFSFVIWYWLSKWWTALQKDLNPFYKLWVTNHLGQWKKKQLKLQDTY